MSHLRVDTLYMNTIDDVVDFLIANDSLELGESPWPEVEEDFIYFPADFGSLFTTGDRNPNRIPIADFDEHGQEDDFVTSFSNYNGWQKQPRECELGEQDSAIGPDGNGPDDTSHWGVWGWCLPLIFSKNNASIFRKKDCMQLKAPTVAGFLYPSAVGSNAQSAS